LFSAGSFVSDFGVQKYNDLVIILPVVLYGCETWSHTMTEEHRMRVFENWVLWRIFGPKREEVTGEWRKLHKEELNYLYRSTNFIRDNETRGITWSGHVACMGAGEVLVWRPDGNRPLGRRRCRWDDNI